MLHRLLSFTPARLAHELGSGRALDNARREHEEFARATAEVDALAGRLASATARVAPVPERVAA